MFHHRSFIINIKTRSQFSKQGPVVVPLCRLRCNSGANTAQSERRGSPLQVCYWVVCKPQHAGNRPSEVSPLFLLSAHQLLVQWRPSPPHSELGLPSSIQYSDTRSNHHHLLCFSFLMLYKWRNYGAKRMLLVGQKLCRPAETPPSTLADPSKGSLPPSSLLTTIIIVILALRCWDAPLQS